MIERITELITEGESRTVEFKRARNEIPGNTYETICAFLNRDGGDLLLGVTDDKLIQGVNPDNVEQMRKNLINIRKTW